MRCPFGADVNVHPSLGAYLADTFGTGHTKEAEPQAGARGDAGGEGRRRWGNYECIAGLRHNRLYEIELTDVVSQPYYTLAQGIAVSTQATFTVCCALTCTPMHSRSACKTHTLACPSHTLAYV